MRQATGFLLSILLLFSAAAPLAAQEVPTPSVAKLTYSETKWIDLHFLLQAQAASSYTFDTKEGGEDSYGDGVWTNDYAIRRARIVLNGQAAPNLTFFVDTDVFTASTAKSTDSNGDTAYIGPYPERKNSIYLQDAHISYKVADELMIDFGKIIPPFMHHQRQSAATLMGVDYAAKFVNISMANNSVDFWRDYGLELRGFIANSPLGGKKGFIDYRMGVFEGNGRVDKNTNPDVSEYQNKNDYPRLTGRVQINLFDVEDGFFYAGTYLGKKKVVSFGGGLDYQPDVYLNNNGNYARDYQAWTADFIIDYPLSEGTVFTLQGGYVNVKNSPSLVGTAPAPTFRRGSSYFAETGLLLFGTVQPVLKYIATKKNAYEYTDGTGTLHTESEDNESYAVFGLNFWINGHNANLKFDYQDPLGDEHRHLSGERKFTLQGQFYI